MSRRRSGKDRCGSEGSAESKRRSNEIVPFPIGTGTRDVRLNGVGTGRKATGRTKSFATAVRSRCRSNSGKFAERKDQIAG